MDMTGIGAVIFSSKTLWGLFGVALFVWIGMSAVLLYHLNTYTKGDAKVRKIKYIYFIGSIVLFISAAAFLFSL